MNNAIYLIFIPKSNLKIKLKLCNWKHWKRMNGKPEQRRVLRGRINLKWTDSENYLGIFNALQ